MPMMQTRRRFVAGLAAAGAAGLVRGPPALAAEDRLETTTVRITKSAALCVAPEYLIEDLLRADGFAEVQYVDGPPASNENVIHRKTDFILNYASNFILDIDAGAPLAILAGSHVGCFELFGSDKVKGITDLKGRSIGIQGIGTLPHVLLTMLTAQVGLDPKKDIHWVTDPKVKPIERFINGEIDAFLGFPPEPQDLRRRRIGHVLVNTGIDRPWSQYFCCMLGTHREFARQNPVATKRVLRAILKATDLCATDPERAADLLVDRGFSSRRDVTAQALRETPYDKWREYDVEDTVRFHALRLRDVGFIKSNPKKIIADGTDWRFLNELKRELKT
jgi:NitT/TauT family transport system substrate-binding protein